MRMGVDFHNNPISYQDFPELLLNRLNGRDYLVCPLSTARR